MNQIHRILFISFLIFILGEYSNSASVKPRTVNFQVKAKEFFIDAEVKKHWLDANEYCKSRGLKLASITSQEENDDIAQQLKFIGATGNFWTSGNDIGITSNYIWESTGEPFTYTKWYDTQPNHGVNTITGEIDHCVSIFIDSWYDSSCSNLYHIICNS